jgi:serine protease Do
MQQRTSNFLPTLLVALIGAIAGSLAMMFFFGNKYGGQAASGVTPTTVSAAPITAGGTSDQERIVSAVKRVSPSVVSLFVTINGERYIPTDPFGLTGQGRVQRYKARASGSGWVYSKDFIVTNAHVVAPPIGSAKVSKIEVLFSNGDRVPAHVYAANIGADLALVKVDNYAKMPPPVEIGNSDKLQAGQWAIAIGEPFELNQTVTVGVVSGFNREEQIGSEGGGVYTFKGLLQTSAPINPGNSGGPLVDDQGRLIGVNQSTANPQAGAQGIGFAVPANTMKQIVAELEKAPGTHQGTNVGYIGATLVGMTPDIRVQLGYQGNGVAVNSVLGGSPADSAGLSAGDVIQQVNGKPVTTAEEVIAAIRATHIGDYVKLEVWSSGVKKLVPIKVAERPADAGPVNPQPQETP